MATVRATRAASEDELAAESAPRLAALAAEGVTTVEIKSGYGLDTANELKQLRVARALGVELDVDVRTTLLAAHALPPEFAGRADDYIDYVCTRHDSRGGARRARRRRGCVLRDDRLLAGADARACSTPRVRTACRSSCTPTSCPTWAAPRSPPSGGAVGGSSRVHERRGHRGHGARGTRGGAAARRVLRAARNEAAADRGAARARRADGDLHRLQSGHVAGDVAGADDEHGLHAVGT